MHTTAYAKLGITLGLIISALIMILHQHPWWFIQNVNLIFHEAGHVLFGFFGTTLTILGGTIMEILIPLVVLIHFGLRQRWMSAAFGAWWLTTALLSVSLYAADARERTLPLITGDVNTHDWFNLLVRYDLLRYDDLIGYLFTLAALGSTGLIGYFALRDRHVRTLLHGH